VLAEDRKADDRDREEAEQARHPGRGVHRAGRVVVALEQQHVAERLAEQRHQHDRHRDQQHERHRVVAQDPQLVAHDRAQRAHATGSGAAWPVSAR
jgi:hypothetical protein